MSEIGIGASRGADAIEGSPQGMPAIAPTKAGESPPASPPIGARDGSGDSEAIGVSDARDGAPPVANFGAGATGDASTTRIAPSSPNPTAGQKSPASHAWRAGEDEGATSSADTIEAAPPHPSTEALIALQRMRMFAIRSQQRIDRACESFIAQALGFRVDADAKERKDIFARAARIRRAIEKGAVLAADTDRPAPPRKRRTVATDKSNAIATEDSAIAAACNVIVVQSHAARAGWDGVRKAVEADMRKLAETLPVWDWSRQVRGLGALGVAIIAAEAAGPRGDVGSYVTKERLWKRLGLAVIEGQRQRRMTDKEGAEAHGYNPKRRAEIWTITDSMFRHQWAGATEESAAHPVGPYGQVYMARKSHTASREWNGLRKEADARRIMSKALVEDYWRVWRGLPPLLPVMEPSDG